MSKIETKIDYRTRNNVYALLNKFGPLPFSIFPHLLETTRAHTFNTLHNELKAKNLTYVGDTNCLSFKSDDIPNPQIIDALWIAAKSLPKAGPDAYNCPLNAFTVLTFIKNNVYYRIINANISAKNILEHISTDDGERLIVIVPNYETILSFPEITTPCRFYALKYENAYYRPPVIEIYQKGNPNE